MSQKTKLPTQESALPGRQQPLKVSGKIFFHYFVSYSNHPFTGLAN